MLKPGSYEVQLGVISFSPGTVDLDISVLCRRTEVAVPLLGLCSSEIAGKRELS